MRPEDIRKLYRAVDPATANEVAQAANEARTDPTAARALMQALYALSVEDRQFALLLRMFLEGMLMRQVQELADADDTYALECGTLIAQLMESTAPPPRGGAKPIRTA